MATSIRYATDTEYEIIRRLNDKLQKKFVLIDEFLTSNNQYLILRLRDGWEYTIHDQKTDETINNGILNVLNDLFEDVLKDGNNKEKDND